MTIDPAALPGGELRRPLLVHVRPGAGEGVEPRHLPVERREALVGAMERTFPQGLPSCASVVLRREAPGYAQEVALFDTGGVPLALYLEAALLNGEMTIMSFQYALSPSDMLDLLK